MPDCDTKFWGYELSHISITCSILGVGMVKRIMTMVSARYGIKLRQKSKKTKSLIVYINIKAITHISHFYTVSSTSPTKASIATASSPYQYNRLHYLLINEWTVLHNFTLVRLGSWVAMITFGMYVLYIPTTFGVVYQKWLF